MYSDLATYRDTDWKFYAIYAQDIFASQEVQPKADCIDWIAINLGDDPVRVNGIYLLPRLMTGLSGASFSPEPNECELYAGPLYVIFEGTGTAPWIQIVQRFFVKEIR